MTAAQPLVFITGASRGIGEATWRLLAKHGYHGVGLARSKDRLEAIAESLNLQGYAAGFECVDLASSKGCVQATKKLLRTYGPPDLVVFNAGTAAHKSFADSSSASRKQELAVNYLGPCAMLDVLLPSCERQGRGTFLAVGSLAAVISFPGNANYAASKAALLSLWRSLQHEYGSRGLSFATILPGLTDTDLAGSHRSLLPKRSPDSVAKAILRLARNPCQGDTLGIENKLTLLLERIAPRTLDRAVGLLQDLVVPSHGDPR